MIGDLLLIVGSCIIAPPAAGAVLGWTIATYLEMRDHERESAP